LLQLIFGLLSLSQVIEALCLGEEVHYQSGLATFGRPLAEIAPYITRQTGDSTLWRPIKPYTNRERKQIHEWVHSGPLAHASVVRETLIGHLLDASIGVQTTMPLECRTYFDGFHVERELGGLNHVVPSTGATCYMTDLVMLERMYGYIINGIYYSYLHSLKGLDYSQNVARAPFIFACLAGTGTDDLERMRTVLTSAIHPHLTTQDAREDAGVYRREEIDRRHLLLAATLADAGSASDILPSALRLRKKLAPLRDHVAKHGLDRELMAGLEDLITRQNVRHGTSSQNFGIKVLGVELKSLTLDMRWLLRPHYLGRRSYLNGLVAVADQYRGIFSLAERLEKLCAP
jgi:hypothetical protein